MKAFGKFCLQVLGALVAHGEVVTWVSCHWERPIWRYATLCVFSNMDRKLSFNNLTIVWNTKIISITSLSGESTDAVYKISWKSMKSPGRSSKKVGLRHFANLRKKTVGGNGRGLYHKIQHNSVNVGI